MAVDLNELATAPIRNWNARYSVDPRRVRPDDWPGGELMPCHDGCTVECEQEDKE